MTNSARHRRPYTLYGRYYHNNEDEVGPTGQVYDSLNDEGRRICWEDALDETEFFSMHEIMHFCARTSVIDSMASTPVQAPEVALDMTELLMQDLAREEKVWFRGNEQLTLSEVEQRRRAERGALPESEVSGRSTRSSRRLDEQEHEMLDQDESETYVAAAPSKHPHKRKKTDRKHAAALKLNAIRDEFRAALLDLFPQSPTKIYRVRDIDRTLLQHSRVPLSRTRPRGSEPYAVAKTKVRDEHVQEYSKYEHTLREV
ncbi:MAG: hypothetical protein MHM6MM_000286, partial [Cercozoa sp. M6MM]